ncbi:MAG: hypothetical protein ACTHK5_02510 [Tsuneonella sp.]
MATVADTKAPWHVWAVGLVSLLWNAFGCYIYAMTMMRAPAMMAQTPPNVRAMMDTAPAWSTAAWALGVWAALLGSILLLMRRGVAVWTFALSLLGLVITAIYETRVGFPMNVPQTAMIWIVALFLLWYAWAMRRRGVLW